MSRAATKKRLEAALETDNSIVVTSADLKDHKGFSLEHMQYLGLTKTDLKTLEGLGVVKSALMKVPTGKINPGFKTQRRYVLVGEVENAETNSK